MIQAPAYFAVTTTTKKNGICNLDSRKRWLVKPGTFVGSNPFLMSVPGESEYQELLADVY
jgi:hypothetical protein